MFLSNKAISQLILVVTCLFAGSSMPAASYDSISASKTEYPVILNSLSGWQIVVPIIFADTINSQSAKSGDLVEGRLVEDLRFGSHLIARQDSLIRGHIVDCGEPRRLATAIVSNDRRMKSRGYIRIQFDEIVDQNNCHIYIQGIPCRQKNIALDTGTSAQALEVDSQGRIIKSEEVLTGGMKVAAISTQTVSNLPVPGSIFFGTMVGPVVLGTVGAISPSLAFNRPVKEEENTRLKGMVRGFTDGLPGVPLIRKGQQVVISPADQIMVSICFKDTGFRLPPK